MLIIEETAVADRSLAQIRASPLRCVDLTGYGLRSLSCDNRIADELPYDTPALWSRALHDHPGKPDGILYRSRHNPRFVCVAVFSRARARLSISKSTPLFARQLRMWSAAQINRYGLALLP